MRTLSLVAVTLLTMVSGANAKTSNAGRSDLATALSAEAVNAAGVSPSGLTKPLLVKAAILLDRAHISPGAIDGRKGDNLLKAIKAYREDKGLPASETIDTSMVERLTRDDPEPVLTEYTVTEDDAKGPFVDDIPTRLEAQSKLKSLTYRNTAEMLSERFHMDEALLRELNPKKDAAKAGTVLMVANVSREADPSKAREIASARTKDRSPDAEERKRTVGRIVVDKDKLTLTAFGQDGKLVGFYPVSVGSEDKPAPTGTLKVVRVSPNPTYVYNPKYAFKGVKAKRKFTIAAGPNNPVGAVWIALDQEGYGVHGTAEPTKIGKTQSHGCVRMTNWSALELAALVDSGVPVEFQGR